MKRFLLSLAAIALGSSALMAQQTVSKTWTLAVSDFGTEYPCTYSSEERITWTIEKTGDGVVQNDFDSQKGVQFGIGGNPMQSLTITSNSFDNLKIKEIEIVTGVTRKGGAELTVNVGEESLTCQEVSGASASRIYSPKYAEFNSFPIIFKPVSPIGGTIVLNWKNITKGLFVKSITVSYLDDGVPTGVDAIDTDTNAPKEYYNLQGIRVANPEKGLYIVRQGSKVSKVRL